MSSSILLQWSNVHIVLRLRYRVTSVTGVYFSLDGNGQLIYQIIVARHNDLEYILSCFLGKQMTLMSVLPLLEDRETSFRDEYGPTQTSLQFPFTTLTWIRC